MLLNYFPGLVAALVVPQLLYGVGFERAPLEIARKVLLVLPLHLHLDLTLHVAVNDVIVSQIGCQGVSTRPVCKGGLMWLFMTFLVDSNLWIRSIFYKVTHQVSNWVWLTFIFVIPQSGLGKILLKCI